VSSAEEVVVLARLAGTRQFVANAQADTAAMEEMKVASEGVGRSFSRTTRHGFLMNQMLFTTRRIMFGTTLGLLAVSAAVVKLGWSYNSSMQQASVALRGFFPTQQAVNDELDRLFQIAKYTPFTFKDATLAFRSLYPPLSKLGVSAGTVNDTILAMANGLSVAGRVSPAALNRVSVALQHMAFQGHLTGQTVNQLARDGINISDVLKKELGLTENQLHNVGKLGIPAMTVLKAINHYMLNEPGYKNAALRQSLMTFHGLWTTMLDSLSQVMGIVEKGIFSKLQDKLMRLVLFFGRISDQMKTTGGSLHDLILAINNELTPNSNGVLKFWSAFSGALHYAWQILSLLVYTLSHSVIVMGTVYLGLVALKDVLHLAYVTMNVWVPLLQILIPLWIAYKATLIGAAIAQGILTFEETLATTATKDLTFFQWLLVASVRAQRIAWWLADAAMAAYIATSTLTSAAVAFMTEEFWFLAVAIEQGVLARVLVLRAALASLRMFSVIGITILIGYELVTELGAGHGHSGLYNFTHDINAKTGKQGIIGQVIYGGLGLVGLASGGTVAQGGLSWVGEHGRELLALPTGATVMSNSESNQSAMPWNNSSPGKPTVIQLVVDRRVLAQAVADEQAEQRARS
jgi:tape measure domain-containing protein